jgi:predicted site-specific integrase-resolvase
MTAVYTVTEFCDAHRISRAHLYNLVKRGDGPVLMKAGKRTLVSEEAAVAWRRRMEDAAMSGANRDRGPR